LTLLNGGRLPAIKPGTIADLIVPAYAIESAAQRRIFTSFVAGPILPKGTVLLVALKVDAGAPGLLTAWENDAMPQVAGHFAQVTLEQPLELALSATKRARLKPCLCRAEALKPPQSKSLNHAYSRLSEVYEPWRDAHTGNVFRRVFYRRQSRKGTHVWEPLDTLRQNMEEIIAAAVEQAAEQSGKASAGAPTS
jgi:hypothetical protein